VKTVTDRIFWHFDFGFVADGSAGESAFPGGESYEVLEFAERLQSSKRLPELNSAPVASWVLARLFDLTKGHMPSKPVAMVAGPMAEYFVSLIAVTRELKPAAFLHLSGRQDMVILQTSTPEGTSAFDVIHAFYSALITAPLELHPCQWSVRGPNKLVAFGWDGTAFCT
jgi:hypothetical protein